MLVGTVLDRHFGHETPNGRQDRRDREVDARVGGKRVIVGHRDEQQRKSEDAAERGCRKRPLIDRNSE